MPWFRTAGSMLRKVPMDKLSFVLAAAWNELDGCKRYFPVHSTPSKYLDVDAPRVAIALLFCVEY
jgi:hypothetical protein